MEAPRNGRRSTPSGHEVVRAPTLKEALQKVRDRFGEEARIVESRTVNQRQDGRLGQERLVEVVVDDGAADRSLAPRRTPAGPPAKPSAEVAEGLVREVERIEKLVATLAAGGGRRAATRQELQDYPLTAPLVESGASLVAIGRLASGFRVDPAARQQDLPAAVKHLTGVLRTGEGDWSGFGGCHVFLGDAGAGKTDLVLGSAARLQAAGRSVLVLSLLPRHGGEIRRLQLEAAAHGYDAAILHQEEQLAGCLDHLGRYDAVLLDTPALFNPAFEEAGDLQRLVAQNESFHRHFVVPADVDLAEESELWEAGRLWNADWIALSRLDRTANPGKLLDILGRLPLPFSLCSAGQWPDAAPELARSQALAGLVLGRAAGEAAASATA